MCELNPIKQLVEHERFQDVKRTLAREALLARLPKRERRAWRRGAGMLGALLVALGKRLEGIGGIEPHAQPLNLIRK